MIKYFCDKCGKQLEYYDIFTIQVIPPEIRQWDDDACTGESIFCRTCLKEFQKWMKISPLIKTTNGR